MIKFGKILFIVLLAATVIPSIAVPEKVPAEIRRLALGLVIFGAGWSLRGSFAKWDKLSERWHKGNKQERKKGQAADIDIDG